MSDRPEPYGLKDAPDAPVIIGTEEVIDREYGPIHYQIVIFRDDQIQKFAAAVVAEMRKQGLW